MLHYPVPEVALRLDALVRGKERENSTCTWALGRTDWVQIHAQRSEATRAGRVPARFDPERERERKQERKQEGEQSRLLWYLHMKHTCLPPLPWAMAWIR